MKFKIRFSQGIITGDEVRKLIELACIDSRLFRQRKSFDEYYFDGEDREIDIPAENIPLISDEFKVTFYCGIMTIEVE